jgi:ribonuclease HI
MAAKKFYAILAGRVPGIYDNWPKAQAQVIGFQGARFKGFATRSEAEAWLQNPTSGPAGPGSSKPALKSSSGAGADTSPRDGVVSIYTDGGARYNPGPGGYGIVQVYNGARKELTGGFRLTTNNRMELMGCIVALRELEHRDKPVALYSDSSYVVNGISKGWAKSWRKRGWIKSDRQPAVNPDLWGQLLDLIEGLNITFNWVKGHNGNPFNERCDELAVASSRLADLPVDSGYKG